MQGRQEEETERKGHRDRDLACLAHGCTLCTGIPAWPRGGAPKVLAEQTNKGSEKRNDWPKVSPTVQAVWSRTKHRGLQLCISQHRDLLLPLLTPALTLPPPSGTVGLCPTPWLWSHSTLTSQGQQGDCQKHQVTLSLILLL